MSAVVGEASEPRSAWAALRCRGEIPERVRRGTPLAGLLGLAAVLYVWGLSSNGYGNEYYAAAVQAGTHSWKAFLFGSLDAANYITVDKPPASFWLMELSSRLFGFSSFSMLLPQALEGVACVWLLYASVRRWFSQEAALLSGLVLALTPVAVVMFRFNNPDALLVLLLVAAGYAVTRALEHGATGWLVLAGVALGFAFLTKMLQAFVVSPGFALVYLVAAPVPLRRRVWQLALAGLAVTVAAGWWVAIVELVPASSRPYIGDSRNNSIFDLIFGPNGLNRLGGGRIGGGSGGLPPAGRGGFASQGFGGASGILRLFNSQMGGEIGWLLPAALIALIAGLVLTARRPRADRMRAGLMLWGGWLLVSGVLYSFMVGVIHPYYTNTLAPPVAALTGVGATLLWRSRRRLAARLALAAMLVVSVVWAFALLERTADWHPWLRVMVVICGLVAAVAVVAGGARLGRAALVVVAAAGLAAALAAPAAYTLSTVARPQGGPDPSAGPRPVPIAGFPKGMSGLVSAVTPRGSPLPMGGSAGSPGSANPPVNKALVSLLERDASRYRWAAATTSAAGAASLELAAGRPVISVGGFTGTDPSTTLARFQQLVAERKIHYWVSDGPAAGPGGELPALAGGEGSGLPPGASSGQVSRVGPGPSGGSFQTPRGMPAGGVPGLGGSGGRAVADEIQAWVSKHFKPITAGGQTIYDLTERTGS